MWRYAVHVLLFHINIGFVYSFDIDLQVATVTPSRNFHMFSKEEVEAIIATI